MFINSSHFKKLKCSLLTALVAGNKNMLSRRSTKNKSSPNILHAAWYKQNSNPYDAIENPNGIINLGTAENRVLEDVIMEKLSTINMGEIPEEYTHYCKLSGTDQFRDELCRFLGKHLKSSQPLDREDVYVMNGCGTVIESIGYAICNEGDGVLIPAPYYCGFKSDLEQRIGVKVVPAHVNSKGKDKPFQLTVRDLENAFLRAENDGIPVKALLLANPNNPLGNIYSEKELKSYMEFCRSYNIHLICDEIYMLSVYDKTAQFKSVLAIDGADRYSDIVHVVWGFSKDFGLSGFRCGVAITRNKDLQCALGSMGYYSSVPTATQYVLEQLLKDDEWIDKMIDTNHVRLRQSRDLVCNELSRHNIPFVYPTSGLFIWMDLSVFLSSKTKECEIELFNTLMDNGVYMVPGFAFETNESGWFRMIISHKTEKLIVAFKRIFRNTPQLITNEKAVNKKKRASEVFDELQCERKRTCY